MMDGQLTETEPLQENPVQAQPSESVGESEVKVNKLYNIISLSYAGVLLFAQLFLFVSMFNGIISVNNVNFTVNGIINALRVISLRPFKFALPTLIPMLPFTVLWIILLVFVIIATIKTLIDFFKFLKLGEDYNTRTEKFKGYSGRIIKNYSNAIMLIAGSLIVSASIPSMGLGVIVLGCIIYACNTALGVCGKLFDKDGTQFGWFDFAINLSAKVIMFMLACLAFAQIKECVNLFLENVVSIEHLGGNSTASSLSLMYLKVFSKLLSAVPFAVLAAAIHIIFRDYPLHGEDKKVNKELKSLFITLLVFALILAVGDGVCYSVFYKSGIGGCLNFVCDNRLGSIFVAIGGIVLTAVTSYGKEQKA